MSAQAHTPSAIGEMRSTASRATTDAPRARFLVVPPGRGPHRCRLVLLLRIDSRSTPAERTRRSVPRLAPSRGCFPARSRSPPDSPRSSSPGRRRACADGNQCNSSRVRADRRKRSRHERLGGMRDRRARGARSRATSAFRIEQRALVIDRCVNRHCVLIGVCACAHARRVRSASRCRGFRTLVRRRDAAR